MAGARYPHRERFTGDEKLQQRSEIFTELDLNTESRQMSVGDVDDVVK